MIHWSTTLDRLSSRAFTLIELLIVVAIIAILAAIAVPNFLEAQVRSKVSAVKANMRTVATAMEAYYVDYNSYTCDSDNTPRAGEDGLIRLTTPVGYITSLATDPFQSHVNPTGGQSARYYELGSGSDNGGWTAPVGGDGTPKINSWLLISVGTDVGTPAAADDTDGNDEWPGSSSFRVDTKNYDPTNGTISDGDIYRAGGDLKQGNYFVDTVKFGEFKQ